MAGRSCHGTIVDSMKRVLKLYDLEEADIGEAISLEHIEAISCSCNSKWKPLLTKLGLSAIDFDDAESSRITDQGKRSKNLQTWKQKNGSDATYKHLIIAQLEMECRYDAEEVCKILKQQRTRQCAGQTGISGV